MAAVMWLFDKRLQTDTFDLSLAHTVLPAWWSVPGSLLLSTISNRSVTVQQRKQSFQFHFNVITRRRLSLVNLQWSNIRCGWIGENENDFRRMIILLTGKWVWLESCWWYTDVLMCHSFSCSFWDSYSLVFWSIVSFFSSRWRPAGV